MFDFAKWTNENTLSALTLVFALIGGVFAYLQWRKSNKVKSSEFINQIIEKLYFTPELVKAFNKILYEDGWYSDNFHHSGAKETLIDTFLFYITYVCYLIKEVNITNEHARLLKYILCSICKSRDVQTYLWNLYHFSQVKICPFQHLVDYGLDNGIISRVDFYDENCDKFTKRLPLQ